MPAPSSESNEFESSINIQTFMLFMVAIAVGLLVAAKIAKKSYADESRTTGG